MIEITNAFIVVFMKARDFLVVWCREKKKKTEDGENVFFKALANFFFNIKKLFMADLASNGLREKVMIC